MPSLIQVFINSVNTNGTGTGSNYSTSVNISEGANISSSYTLTVPDDTSSSWKVHYDFGWAGQEGYLPSGYYATGGTTWDAGAATSLPGGQDYSDINLTLLTGKTITGSVALPSGQTAPPGGISVTISAEDDQYISTYSSSASISEGATSGTYTIRIPDDPKNSWIVSYSFDIFFSAYDYVDKGYYTSSGTTWSRNSATPLPGGQDLQNIDLTLLPGKTIEGSISLPPGQTAPGGGTSGIYLIISAEDQNEGGGGPAQWECVISEGNTSTTYELRVPDDPAASWRVRYQLEFSSADYLQYGYYAGADTTWDSNAATMLPGGQDHAGIDMELLEGRVITGTVSMPAGETAPVTAWGGGLAGQIVAEDSTCPECTWKSGFLIPSGESSVTYSLLVPDSNQISLLIYYDTNNFIEEIPYGYYTIGYHGDQNTTTWKREEAEPLAAGTGPTDLDLTLLTGPTITISGTVYLPGGSATEHLCLDINVYDADSHPYNTVTDCLDPGTNRLAYSVTVPQDAAGHTWRVGYRLRFDNTNYPEKGFYSTTRTVAEYSSASPLSATADHTGIDMTLISNSSPSKTSFPWALFLPAIFSASQH